jgi:DNA-binding transcriptional LysR family regulator
MPEAARRTDKEEPEIAISAMWHPRLDAEPAHRWLRETIIAVCKSALEA